MICKYITSLSTCVEYFKYLIFVAGETSLSVDHYKIKYGVSMYIYLSPPAKG